MNLKLLFSFVGDTNPQNGHSVGFMTITTQFSVSPSYASHISLYIYMVAPHLRKDRALENAQGQYINKECPLEILWAQTLIFWEH